MGFACRFGIWVQHMKCSIITQSNILFRSRNKQKLYISQLQVSHMHMFIIIRWIKNVYYICDTKNKKQKLWENICEIEIWNLSPMKHYFFSSESPGPPTIWILSKQYELCESCCSNWQETLEWKSFGVRGHWRTMYLWICHFAPVISLRYTKYILVHSSKILA